jgi:hypothetical protein
MKAKLPEAERTLAASTKYLCVWCDTEFYKQGHILECPNCTNSEIKDIIPIYLEDDLQEEALYCPVDFTGG